jgi:hypothetical protein
MKKKEIKCSCKECKNEASFFHSGCCGVHFEGVVDKEGLPVITCEKCGKYCGSVFQEESQKNKKYKI